MTKGNNKVKKTKKLFENIDKVPKITFSLHITVFW